MGRSPAAKRVALSCISRSSFRPDAPFAIRSRPDAPVRERFTISAHPSRSPWIRFAGAGVALLATEATVLRIELWCARDVPSSFVRPLDLARMAASNAVAAAVSAGCAWLLATAFSAGPGAIAIAGLLVYSAVDIVAAVALRDDTALMLVGKARVALRRG